MSELPNYKKSVYNEWQGSISNPKIYGSTGYYEVPNTPKRTPLRSNHEAIMVTGGVFSVVVTVTVIVIVACPFPPASFSFTGTPIGTDVMLAPSALDVEISGEGCEAWGLGDEACALFPLDEI